MLKMTGPLLSSYHYILDVQLLGEMAKILGNETLAEHYSAMAEQLWPVFNRVYLAEQQPPPASGLTCGTTLSRSFVAVFSLIFARVLDRRIAGAAEGRPHDQARLPRRSGH